MLHIHHYSMHSLYKPGPVLDIADWLIHHNYVGNQEIIGMNINIHTISTIVDIPICMYIEDIRAAMKKDVNL